MFEDDPDLRNGTLPTEQKLGEFLTKFYLNTIENKEYHSMYHSFMKLLMNKYKLITECKLNPSATMNDNPLITKIKFRPSKILYYCFLSMKEYFNPNTCQLYMHSMNDLPLEENIIIDERFVRQFLIDILRYLFASIDDIKYTSKKSKKSKEEEEKPNITDLNDEQLLISYYPMLEKLLLNCVKSEPNIVLMVSSIFSIPTKPELFTKMIQSFVINGDVQTLRSMYNMINDYYNSNSSNPYIFYIQSANERNNKLNDYSLNFDIDDMDMDDLKHQSITKQEKILKEQQLILREKQKMNQDMKNRTDISKYKPWLSSAVDDDGRFLPYNMLDNEQLAEYSITISDLLIFDGLLYDQQLSEALVHLANIYDGQMKENVGIAHFVVGQIMQRSLNYIRFCDALQNANDVEYVSKVTEILSDILNTMPVIDMYDDGSELFEDVWNECGFTRGAMVLQGMCGRLKDGHCMKEDLNTFCIQEFTKLSKYGLLDNCEEEEYIVERKNKILIQNEHKKAQKMLTIGVNK